MVIKFRGTCNFLHIWYSCEARGTEVAIRNAEAGEGRARRAGFPIRGSPGPGRTRPGEASGPAPVSNAVLSPQRAGRCRRAGCRGSRAGFLGTLRTHCAVPGPGPASLCRGAPVREPGRRPRCPVPRRVSGAGAGAAPSSVRNCQKDPGAGVWITTCQFSLGGCLVADLLAALLLWFVSGQSRSPL